MKPTPSSEVSGHCLFRRPRRQGQALIELTAAMLVVVILVAGVVQFSELAGRKGETIATVRVAAGTRALASGEVDVQTPDYFHTWTEGNDQIHHTSDDGTVPDYFVNLQLGITDQSVAQPGQWAYLAGTRNGSHYTLAQGDMPMAAMGFVYEIEARTVELMPVMREWHIYNRDSVRVATDIWMPRLHLEGFDPVEGEE